MSRPSNILLICNTSTDDSGSGASGPSFISGSSNASDGIRGRSDSRTFSMTAMKNKWPSSSPSLIDLESPPRLNNLLKRLRITIARFSVTTNFLGTVTVVLVLMYSAREMKSLVVMRHVAVDLCGTVVCAVLPLAFFFRFLPFGLPGPLMTVLASFFWRRSSV